MTNNEVLASIIGKQVSSVEGKVGSCTIKLDFVCYPSLWMEHEQECCESVHVEDIAGGRLMDLIGETILEAYESTKNDTGCSDGCGMWTFYTIRTMNRTLTIRFYGESNGYYSVGVDCCLVKKGR